MATFKYIKGNNKLIGIPNAVKYKLYCRYGGTDDEFDYEELAEQSIIQPLAQIGGMMVGSVEKGSANQLNFNGGITSMARFISVKPRRILTETGFRYYVVIRGEMNVELYDKEAQIYVPFEKTIYLDERGLAGSEPNVYAPEFNIYQDLVCNRINRPDGIYIHIEYGNPGETEASITDYVKMYNIDLTQTDIRKARIVQEASTATYAYLIDRAQGYFHTEFIPLQCLTDEIDWTNSGSVKACVGPFDTASAGKDDVKITFFDKDLNYHGRITAEDISAAAAAGDIYSAEYLTQEEVVSFSKGRFDDSVNPDENSYFVVFSSAMGTPVDKVSLREIYFPMFALEKKLVKEEKLDPSNQNMLVVKAIADGLFYLDSPYSNVIPYDCQYEY